MPLLFYWLRKYYMESLKKGFAFHLNQTNPLLHDIDEGESVWAFTRDSLGRYVLSAELIVLKKTLNEPDFKHGRYRVWGDPQQSRYFSVEGQEDVEELIRELSCTTNAPILARSFQGRNGVKQLLLADHQRLSVFAQDIPLQHRYEHDPLLGK